ncbi:unnamed protein product [Plutella xylostella]|uniref:(diamondback moth) hypothetical protein n=1 Tax=Plutella xylostella TaxID=51655 RepID=A0A8S4G814_PLUXY|nr:unnamed protein product [Plutella xylostella]
MCIVSEEAYFEASRRRLSEYIEHYEELDYDAGGVHAQHVRHRRSTGSELRVNFKAHGRRFALRLRRDLSAFSEEFKVKVLWGWSKYC